MHFNTTTNLQNRGTFQLEDTVFKSGNSSSDRQSSGETFTPYRQGDTMEFRQRPVYQQPVAQRRPGLDFLSRLLNLDLRVYTALIAGILIATFFHALFSEMPLLTVVIGILSFFVWYIMSFFNFQHIFNLLVQGPDEARQRATVRPSASY